MKKGIKTAIFILLCLMFVLSVFGCKKPETEPENTISQKTSPAATIAKNIETEEVKNTPEYTSTPEATSRQYSKAEISDAIVALVKTQENAIITGDSELMAQTINPNDSFLKTEAMHLAADQKAYPASNYKRAVSDVYKEGAHYYATLEQTFTFQGKSRSSIESRRYMFEDARAYDMGTVLEKEKWDNVFIAFPEGEYELAESLSKTANRYIDSVNEMWNRDFVQPVSIKIYDDKDVFLYSIKLSLPDWVGGWYENGESIKTYFYGDDLGRYEYLVRHEATHMMLSAATNDNAAYWMQEGFATTMPALVTEGKLKITREDVLKQANSQGKLYSVDTHIKINLEELTDIFEVRMYYGYSSAMIVYMIENMDSETLQNLFSELETHPYISLTMSEKAYDIQAITEKCFKKAIGISFIEFFEGFEDWLSQRLS